jgi:uncharacterized SAM-binding protein YcdF (DUF218 family)
MLLIFIHRFLQSFMLPPLNSLIIILLGTIFFKKRCTKIIVIAIGGLSLYLQATPYVAFHLNKIIAPQPLNMNDLPKAQAMVVLGGGVNNYIPEYNGEFNTSAISNTETFVRVRYAAFLAKKEPNLPIFVSGGAIDTKDSEASVMKLALQEEFNVTNQIYLEPDSRTTNENAKFTANLLAKYKYSTVVLVTSASHMRRAKALFEQNGIHVIAAPTNFYSLGYKTMPMLWFVPTSHAMSTTSAVLHEFIGYFYDVDA